jgi:hypothetical protein
LGLESRVAVTSGAMDPERVVGLLQWKPDLLMAKPIDFVRLFSACIGIESALTPMHHLDFAPTGYLESVRPRKGPALASSAG